MAFLLTGTSISLAMAYTAIISHPHGIHAHLPSPTSSDLSVGCRTRLLRLPPTLDSKLPDGDGLPSKVLSPSSSTAGDSVTVPSPILAACCGELLAVMVVGESPPSSLRLSLSRSVSASRLAKGRIMLGNGGRAAVVKGAARELRGSCNAAWRWPRWATEPFSAVLSC